MPRFTAVVLSLLMLGAAHPAIAQSIIDTTLVMDDGVRIDALYVLPATPPPAGGHPAILLVHGFGGSKNNNRSLALRHAREGYAAAAYSVRGQGASEGQFVFFASERILDDLRAGLAFTKALPDVNPERVAVMGGSQGGLHAWNAAAFDMGARCVVSIIANGRVEENWLENDALNWTFAAATLSPDVRLDAGISSMLRQARESGVFTQLRPFLDDQSTIDREAEVTTPTAIIVSYHDGFFNQNAALRQFASIPAAKRIMLYRGGHSLPPDSVQNAEVQTFIDRWLRHWLRDDPSTSSVALADSAVVFYDGHTGERRAYAASEPSRWLDAGDPPPAGMRAHTLYFDAAGLADAPPPSRSERLITYINVLGSTPLSFRTPPLTEDLVILPPPGEARIRVRATGNEYQMNVLLYGVDPATGRRTPLNRGHRQAADPNVERTLDFELTSILHTVPAGHVIEALVNGGVALIPDQATTFGNFVLGTAFPSLNTFVLGGDEPSQLRLWVQDASVSASEAVAGTGGFRLLPAWPNPASNGSTITVELPSAALLRLTLHDAMGRELRHISDEVLTPGRHAKHVITSDLRTGIYFIRATTGTTTQTERIAVFR